MKFQNQLEVIFHVKIFERKVNLTYGCQKCGLWRARCKKGFSSRKKMKLKLTKNPRRIDGGL